MVSDNTQTYEPDNSDEPNTNFIAPESRIITDDERPTLGDAYDLYGLASRVHSKNTSMTTDYVLANYSSELINAKLPKFVREQRKVVRILKSFMLVSNQVLERRYGTQYATKAKTIMRACYADSEQLFLGEIDEMVIITRAGKGAVTKAMLTHGRTDEEKERYDAAVDANDDMMDRLKETKK